MKLLSSYLLTIFSTNVDDAFVSIFGKLNISTMMSSFFVTSPLRYERPAK